MWEKNILSLLEPGPFSSAQRQRDGGILIPICAAAAEAKGEAGTLSGIGAAPGPSCLYVAFGTRFRKHSAYFQVSP